jgi:hypothetical protein
MKSSNIPENTQGNKEGLIEVRNDNYADYQDWNLLGPGIGENRSYPCTLHEFEINGLYIDLRLSTDKYKFNVLGVQPWHFYEKGEYRDAMEWLLKNRKPKRIRTVLLSLAGFGFFNNTSPEDVAFVMEHSDELRVIVTGPPADHKSYRADVIKAVAASGKPIHIYSSVNDTKDGTSFVYSQTLHDQLKAEGANVTLTMFSPGFGHNGTATHVWSGSEFYKWAQEAQGAPVPTPDPVTAPVPETIPDPVVIVPPVEAPPVQTPPVVNKPPRKIRGYNIYGDNIKIQPMYTDGPGVNQPVVKGDEITVVWIEEPKSATLIKKKSGTHKL